VPEEINPNGKKIKRDAGIAGTLLRGYTVYILLGGLLLMLPFASVDNSGKSIIDSMYISASAVTTTGLVSVPTSSFNFLGQLIILILIQLGGIGYMTLGSFLLLLRGKDLNRGSYRLLNQSFTLPKSFSIKSFIINLVIFTLVIEVIIALILLPQFMNDDRANPVWSAIFHSVSAFSCAGFSLYDDNLMSYNGNAIVNMAISAASLLGGLGFIVLNDFSQYFKSKKVTFTTKIIIVSITGLVLMSTIGLVLYDSKTYNLMSAFFHSVTAITGAGFNTVPSNMSSFGGASFIILCILMFIGAAPAGTGGGVKVTNIVATLANLKSIILDKKPTIFKNEIPEYRVRSAVAHVFSYTLILVLGILLVLLFEPNSNGIPNPSDYIFEAFSAIGTAGLSTGVTANMSVMGKITMIVLMFAGRVGTKTIAFYALAIRSKDVHKYKKSEDIAT
jgi:trk system potassium uptake protein TrkH